MKRFLLGMFICLLFSLSVASVSTATLFNKYYEGDRVVYDDMNDLYWYPILTDFINMTRAEQVEAIENLTYAGTDNWRMATATETTAQKFSLAEMATTVIPTCWAHYGEPTGDDEIRTLSSPNLAYGVAPADFFTPTKSLPEGAFWSGGTPAYVFNGRTTGWGWTNTGPNGFGGELELLYAKGDDHFVAHSLRSDIPYRTMTYNYDLHLRGDEETLNPVMGEIGAWVVTNSIAPVPEPSTLLLLGSGLAGLAFYRRKRK